MREGRASTLGPAASKVVALGAALGRARARLKQNQDSSPAQNRRLAVPVDDEKAHGHGRRVSIVSDLVPERRRGSLLGDNLASSSQVRASRRSSLAASVVSSIAPSAMQDSGLEISFAAANAGLDDAKPSSAASASGSQLPRPKCNALSLFARSNSQQRGAEASKFGMHVRKLLGEMGATKELPKTVLTKAPDIVGFQTCQHGTVLFEEGQEPDCCFVVLQGRVQLWRQGPECDVPWPAEEGSLSARKHCTTIASMLSKLAGREGQQESGVAGEGGRSWRSNMAPIQNFGYIVASCGPGTMFGDAELLEFQPRMATAVVCSDSCEMLVIARSDFDSLLRSPILKAEVLKVSTAIRQMLMQFSFFQRLESDVQASVAEVMHFGFQRKGEVVFRQGDPPGLCYIILSGEVGVWVDGLEDTPSPPRQAVRRQTSASSLLANRDASPMMERINSASFGLVNESGRASFEAEHQPPLGRGSSSFLHNPEVGRIAEEAVNKRASMREVHMPNRDCGNQASRNKCHAILASLHRLHALKRMAADADGPSSEDDIKEELSQAKQVAWLGPGKMFGELALLEDQPRSATVTCMEDCAFLTIEGSDFDRVLKRAMNGAVMSLPILAEPLLKELPFFQTLRPMVQQRVRHIVNYKTVKRGQVLFWQSDAPERCYILLSGQVSGWRRGESEGPSSYAGQENDLPPESTSQKCSELASRLAQIQRQDEPKEEKSRRLSDSVFQRFGQRRAMQRRGSVTEVMGVQEVILREGAVFNEQALLMDEPCEVTMTCDKDCQLLYIEKAQFDRVVKEEVIRLKVQELKMQVRRLFRGFPLFEDLGPSVQATVPEIARYSFEPAGSVLFKEGDVAELCYIMLSGEVTIWKIDEGKEDLGYSTMDGVRSGSRSPNKDHGRSGSRSPRKERALPSGSAESPSQAQEAANHRGNKIEDDSAVEPTSDNEADDEEDEDDEVAELGMYAQKKRGGSKDFLPSLGGLVRDNGRDHLQHGNAPGLSRDSTKEVLPGLSALMNWHSKELDGGQEPKRAQHFSKESNDRSGTKDGALPPVERKQSKGSTGSDFGSSSDEEPVSQQPTMSATLSLRLPAAAPKPVLRPQVTRAHPDAFERCTQLAAKLEPVSRCLRGACKRAPGEPEEEGSRPGETAVACLGPGSLFGEWALLNNDPRSATVTCHSDCEFLVIEKCDFDRVVKADMAKAKQEKQEFLQTYVPGIKQLAGRKMEELLNFFERKTVPWNHVFLEQGQIADGSVYFVWRGSVEFYTSSFPQTSGGEQALLPEKGFRRLRVLIKGGVFGAVPMKAKLSFTAVARSSPCEVLQVSMERLRQLPESVMKGLRKLLDQTTAWRADTNTFPSDRPGGVLDRCSSRGASRGSRRPAGAAWGSSAAAALPSLPGQVPRPQSSKIPRPLSSKIPRPLDGKFPGLLGSKGSLHHASAPLLGKISSATPGHSPTWGGGLFRRDLSNSEDLELLDVQPGEVLALRAHRPKRREDVGSPTTRSPASGAGGKSVSLPSMPASPKR